MEDVEPAFAHYPKADLPTRSADGVSLSVIAGQAYGMTSPVATLWPTLYVDVSMSQDSRLEVPDHAERAVYIAEGEVMVAGTRLRAGQLGLLAPNSHATLESLSASRLMLLGGDRFATPRFIWWNFVASSRERIEQAKARWRDRQFAPVPGETEFIPLPRQ
jgi:hypothetical protein